MEDHITGRETVYLSSFSTHLTSSLDMLVLIPITPLSSPLISETIFLGAALWTLFDFATQHKVARINSCMLSSAFLRLDHELLHLTIQLPYSRILR